MLGTPTPGNTYTGAITRSHLLNAVNDTNLGGYSIGLTAYTDS